MTTILVSTISDNNIFHIFAFDIIKYYNPFINIIYINDKYIDKNNPCQLWRIFVMKKLYPNIDIQYNNNFKLNCITHNGFNHKDFINYRASLLTRIFRDYFIIDNNNELNNNLIIIP